MGGGAQCLRDTQPPVQPSGPRWRSHTHAQKWFLSVLASEMLWTANVTRTEGFSRGKSDGSLPPISPSQSMEKVRGSSRVIHTVARSISGAHRSGRKLVPRVPATRSVATPVRTGSCAPSRGRPRGGALVPSCAASAGRGRSQQRQRRVGWRWAPTPAEKSSPGGQEAEGAEPPGHEPSVSSRRLDAGSAHHKITVRFVTGVCLAL